jgi:hypothetical protein
MKAEVFYSFMADIPVDIAVSLKPRIPLPPESQVYVLAPNTFSRYGCGNDVVGLLNPLSLGMLLDCQETAPTAKEPEIPMSVMAVFNSSLEAGQYSLTIPAQTPSRSGSGSNSFEVYVRNPDGTNADVALGIPGEELVLGYRMIVWPLWWDQVPPNDATATQSIITCQVSVPIELLQDASIPVSMILISLPLSPAMNHMVRSLSDVQISSGKRMPLPVTGLVVPDRNSFLLALDESQMLKQGIYAIRFYIEVPVNRSKLDIWRVAICGPGADQTTCSLDGTERVGRGSGVQAVFALPGFDAKKAPGTSLLLPIIAGATSGAHQTWQLSEVVFASLVLAVWRVPWLRA